MLKYYKPKAKYLQMGGALVGAVTQLAEETADKINVGLSAASGAVDTLTAGASASLGIKTDAADGVMNAAADVASQFGPWGKVAAIGIKGVNFLSKLGGENVQGFKGDTGSSGFRDFTMEDKQQRNGAALLNPLSAITGMFTKSAAAIEREKEVEKQKAAFAAAKNLADTQKEQNAARAQRLEDQQIINQQQLSGENGYDAILAKKGAKLEALRSTVDSGFSFDEIFACKAFMDIYNQLEDVEPQEVSMFLNGGSVIPDGALHKEKHNLEKIDPELKDNITHKGIPVITKDEDGTIVQHAEVEREEIIIELSLTKKLEKLWKEGTEEAMLEAGKLLAEEIMTNTEDNTDLTEKIMEDESDNK